VWEREREREREGREKERWKRKQCSQEDHFDAWTLENTFLLFFPKTEEKKTFEEEKEEATLPSKFRTHLENRNENKFFCHNCIIKLKRQ
jgi:hypothetical protein